MTSPTAPTPPTAAGSPASELRFPAMGTSAHVVVVGGGRAVAEDARARIDDLESKWSRFRLTSEVSALNRFAGDPVVVSADTRLLVERARSAWRITGGAFDPTVLGAVVRAGYTQSFDRLPADVRPGASDQRLGCGGIEQVGATVRLPAGTGFDPGGIGKGLAADLVVTELMAAGAAGACVNLGGDLRVAGVGPTGGPWTVAVEHPHYGESFATLALGAGAVATSSPLRRRWQCAGVPVHHVVDPSTELPARVDLAAVTVVSGEAWVAEVMAKAVLLAGATSPFAPIGGTGSEALVVDDAGRVACSAGLDAYLASSSFAPPVPTLPPPVPNQEVSVRW